MKKYERKTTIRVWLSGYWCGTNIFSIPQYMQKPISCEATGKNKNARKYLMLKFEKMRKIDLFSNFTLKYFPKMGASHQLRKSIIVTTILREKNTSQSNSHSRKCP